MAQPELAGSIAVVINAPGEPREPAQQGDAAPFQLSRWLVSFGSGPDWYPAGEFIAVDAAAAIDRAIEIFGCASGYRAEEIPWDAAPLPRMNPVRSRPSR
jgi:hypothetical protein